MASDWLIRGCEAFILTNENLKQIMDSFLNDVKKGLGKETHQDSIVKCFITYVQDLPTGNERGKFLALDLGGTNFRVLLITLGENHYFDQKSKVYEIPGDVMVGTAEQLFDHVADCLADFTVSHGVAEEELPLGFTFSFPLVQKGLTVGILERWTKGFKVSGCIGKDVVQLLKDAIARQNIVKIEIVAILNDTTGTLMSCGWKNPNCRVGLIVGTGSNACFVEKVENAEMFEGHTSKPYVIINCESGAFGDDGSLDFIRTEHDFEADKNTINPGKQVHEKMISGMYLGEVVRLVLEKYTKEGQLFGGKGSDLLFERWSFATDYISKIESDERGLYVKCSDILETLGLSHATAQDCVDVRYVCEVVSRRSAHLAAACVSTLINKMGYGNVTVGIDGSVYRYHPHYHNLMMEKMAELVDPGIKFDIMLSEDGSGRGAALVAAAVSHKK